MKRRITDEQRWEILRSYFLSNEPVAQIASRFGILTCQIHRMLKRYQLPTRQEQRWERVA